jgi:large subunit ribosomal protein L3
MRVIPGKALPGHMGAEQVTIQNLEIIKVDMEENCILVKGSVPGPRKGFVIIKSAVKTDEKKKAFDLISYEEEVVEEETPAEAVEETNETTEAVEEVTEEKTEEVSETSEEEATSEEA